MLFLFLSSQPQHNKFQATQQPAQQEQTGTLESPLVIKVLPSAKSAQESEEEIQDRKQKAATDRNLVRATWVLAGIGILQLFVFGAQAFMLKQTVDASADQGTAMREHIDEARRSATAMEDVVATIEAGNKAVMRAYLTAIIGDALYQERRPGQSDLKFEGRPNLINTGNTQARKVRIRINAGILPNPIPNDFGFPLPEEDRNTGDATVAAHQSYVLGGVVEEFVPDVEIASIKEGAGKSLFVWGLVMYEDIFGDRHTTKFGQQITWLPNGRVFGYYIPGQNDAD